MIDARDRAALLQIARAAIAAQVTGQAAPEVPLAGDLARSAAAFVTLSQDGQLRGCIGHIEADEPLGAVVARCAVAAGTSDPRFSPVVQSELEALEIEISILGPFETVADASEVEVGRHGLFVELEGRRGLLLPQVASEWHWDAPTFIAQTCLKAGLPSNAWQRGAGLWRFEADVFSEKRTGSFS
jgi:AmmeMemoRadiSam system protein A